MEMRRFHKHFGISYRDHITNKEMETRTENAIGLYEDLMTSVKSRKLKWYGYVTQTSGLTKTVLQGTIQADAEPDRENDERKKNKNKQKNKQNKTKPIREWIGFEWNIILQKVENHEELRRLVATTPMVPRRQPDYWIVEGEGET